MESEFTEFESNTVKGPKGFTVAVNPSEGVTYKDLEGDVHIASEWLAILMEYFCIGLPSEVTMGMVSTKFSRR
jgi:hypothetical protein